jgi:hypothetical protein
MKTRRKHHVTLCASIVALLALDCVVAQQSLTATGIALSRKLAKVSFALLQNDSQFDPLAHRSACMST